jgi:hypothetical protein
LHDFLERVLMKKTVYEKNFDRLVELGVLKPDGLLNFQDCLKLKSAGYMDLNIDHLSHKDAPGQIVIAMAHNYIQEGDVMADPDMEIRIIPEMRMVEALTYQLDSMGVYHRVYSEDGSRFDPERKKELNAF